MTHTIEQLTALFNKAADAARNSLTGDDGGSCNLDICYVKREPGMMIALEKSILSSIPTAGLFIAIMPQYQRQGFERTSQCQAIAKVFNEAGIEAYVEYIMD